MSHHLEEPLLETLQLLTALPNAVTSAKHVNHEKETCAMQQQSVTDIADETENCEETYTMNDGNVSPSVDILRDLWHRINRVNIFPNVREHKHACDRY